MAVQFNYILPEVARALNRPKDIPTDINPVNVTADRIAAAR
jgi:hypothetical protein